MPKPAILEKEYTYKNTKAVVIDKSRDDLRDSEVIGIDSNPVEVKVFFLIRAACVSD